DDLAEALSAAHEADEAAGLLRAYAEAFGDDYRAAFTVGDAVADIAIAERLTPGGIEAQFLRRAALQPEEIGLTFHHLGEPIPLSRRVPMLENLGFSVINERTFRIDRGDRPALFLHDMAL